jgi:hypothetical protein
MKPQSLSVLFLHVYSKQKSAVPSDYCSLKQQERKDLLVMRQTDA